VGKHHVGHAQWKQTPVGLGFETHVGSYLWSMEYYRKGLWELPWEHFTLDWVRAHENGTYSHFAEARHTTDALTDEAVAVMESHAAGDGTAPLFLYLAYTAAHAPLEPLEADLAACAQVPNELRRKFCGLMQGLDRSVGRVASTARQLFGDNVVFVFTSDNGGAPWFGGLNAPLRSGKTMPFEGGVRVPTFFADFRQRVQQGSAATTTTAVWDHMSHISDLMPTFATLAGASLKGLDDIDGVDLSIALAPGNGERPGPRTEVLLDMYYGSQQESLFDEDLHAIRQGKWKLIESVGGFRDAEWYKESTSSLSAINSTDETGATEWTEWALQWLEGDNVGDSKYDTLRDLMVHLGFQAYMRSRSVADGEHLTLLFDIEADPEERLDVSAQHPDIVDRLRKRAAVIAAARPVQQKYWMTVDRDAVWPSTLKPGDCSMNPGVEKEHCWFAHPWVPDDADLDSIELVFGASAYPFVRSLVQHAALLYGLPVGIAVFAILLAFLLSRRKEGRVSRKEQGKEETGGRKQRKNKKDKEERKKGRQ
jgi:arylsulfatase A-like enzyme